MLKITMFYSYKGGVGKTTNLLNVAAILSRRGQKVGIVDLDFEAPGLSALYNIDTSRHDLLEMLAYRPPVADVENHAISVNLASGADVQCLPVSGEQEYLDRIDWTNETTFAYLREALKAFQSSFSLNHMLLDTRSGVSFQAAFAIKEATHAVLAGRLDKQSQKGISRLRIICRARQLAYTIVANAVPITHPLLDPTLSLFNDEVGQRPDIIIPYDPQLYFKEAIVKEGTDIHLAYEQLTDLIQGKI